LILKTSELRGLDVFALLCLHFFIFVPIALPIELLYFVDWFVHIRFIHRCRLHRRAQKEEKEEASEDDAAPAKAKGVKDNLIFFHIKLPPNMQVCVACWCHFVFVFVYLHRDVLFDTRRAEPHASAATTCANEKRQSTSRGL
jgi:hypothetical protein